MRRVYRASRYVESVSGHSMSDSITIPLPPPVTNGGIASALLALSASEKGERPRTELRAAAWTLRQLPEELYGRRVRLAGLPHVSPRAADAIGAFLACGSDESVEDRVTAILDRADPARHRKSDFLTCADVDRILKPSPPGPGEGERSLSSTDVRGDLHLHTDRSDGKVPLGSLHRSLAARGDCFAFLTDHARDCAVAGGLFAGDFAAQRLEVDLLNERTEGEFRMFLGAEANIDADGSLDVTPESVPVLDAVIASIHTDLRSHRDQTERLVRAIRTPGVAILGHPRGRLYDLRSGIRANWERVFSVAAEEGVAIELNGCPERCDLEPRLAALARDAGCLFAVCSDAHARHHLDYLRFSVAIARLAAIPKGRVVNTLSAERLEEWLAGRRVR
jgi:histidinol phosphatase-like PHP family hydrolase